MAEKVAAPPPVVAPADDLAVLFPDQLVQVAGARLVVREFRFREGLDIKVEARGFLDDLRALIQNAPTEDGVVLGQIEAIAARHADRWIGWIARACDREPAFVEQLTQADRRRIEVAFWKANQDFFLNPLIADIVFADLAAARSRSPDSSSRSLSTA